MHAAIRFTVLAAALTLATPAVAAQDTSYFVVTLGSDTTSVERVVQAQSRVVVDQVGRAPRVMRRHFEYDYSGSDLTGFSMRVVPAGDTLPTQTIEARSANDSLYITTTSGTAAPRLTRGPFPKGTLVQALSSPWGIYEQQLTRMVAQKADSLKGRQYFIGADDGNDFMLRRIGPDSVSITNDRGDAFHVQVDASGSVLGVLPISGTGMFAVKRATQLDLDALAASFLARDKSGAGIGVLSPRDSVRVANAGGAALAIDYSRPGKRGREIYGNVVPFGAVWRTGANAATLFKTDKALSFGGKVVPAGAYTLWTIPGASSWKLMINTQTGQWGTDHDASKDIATVDMTLGTLSSVTERFTISVEPSAQGGVLHLDWDFTRASAAFTVAP